MLQNGKNSIDLHFCFSFLLLTPLPVPPTGGKPFTLLAFTPSPWGKAGLGVF